MRLIVAFAVLFVAVSAYRLPSHGDGIVIYPPQIDDNFHGEISEVSKF